MSLLTRNAERFCCLRVGDTGGTDIARHFDPVLARKMFGTWLEQGLINATVMDPEDLGIAVVETMAMLLIHPTISLPYLVIKPIGPAVRPEDLENLLDNVKIDTAGEVDSRAGESATFNF